MAIASWSAAWRGPLLGIGDRQIGQLNRGFLRDDAALGLLGLTRVALDHVDSDDDRASFRRIDRLDLGCRGRRLHEVGARRFAPRPAAA